MSVHQKKDGRWFVKYYVQPTGAEKKKEKREYFGRGKEAEAVACQRDQELKSTGKINRYTSGLSQPSSPSIAELAAEYMDSKQNSMTKVSSSNLWYKLTSVILPELGHIEIRRLTAHRLDLYVKKRLKDPVTKRIGTDGAQRRIPVKDQNGKIKTIAKTTIHRELTDLQAILNFGVKRKIIAVNPVAGYEKPKRDDEIIRPPSASEIKQILAVASPHLFRALVINYYTGLRPGVQELSYITWNDINWDTRQLLIRSARKGGALQRSIFIHPEMMAYLTAWKEQDAKNKHDYIVYWKGKPIKSFKTAFNAAKRRAGITRRLRPYDFRHAAVTSMLEGGADLKSVSVIAGHANTQITTKVYQHLTSKILEDSITKIPALGMDITLGH